MDPFWDVQSRPTLGIAWVGLTGLCRGSEIQAQRELSSAVSAVLGVLNALHLAK